MNDAQVEEEYGSEDSEARKKKKKKRRDTYHIRKLDEEDEELIKENNGEVRRRKRLQKVSERERAEEDSGESAHVKDEEVFAQRSGAADSEAEMIDTTSARRRTIPAASRRDLSGDDKHHLGR